MVNTVPNSLERLITDIGLILVGASPVNAMPALTSGEIFFSTARRSDAKAVIICPAASENSDWILIKDGICDAIPLKNGLHDNGNKENGEEFLQKTIEVQKNSDKPLGHESFVLDYRSEQAPKMMKAILISRKTNWQCENIPTVPHFLEFLDTLGEGQEFIETQVVPSDVGYYHTTTGTTGMQKIVPRLHSSLLKVAAMVGQMAPCRLPILFVTLNLGWNSGFPFMFFHFGSICVMIDDIDLGNNGVKSKESMAIGNNIKGKQNNGHIISTYSNKVGRAENGIGITLENESNSCELEENRKDDDDSLIQVTDSRTQNRNVQGFKSIYEVYWHAINVENIPFAHLSPTEIDGMACVNKRAVCQGRQPSGKMAFVVTGGLPVKQSIVSGALESVCESIVVFYGMTEAGVVSYNVVSSAENYTEGECGRLYHGVQGRITDDAGNILPPDQIGNIEFKTETLFGGFLKNVEKTKEAFTPDGWLVTADLGFLKPDGTLTVLCRRDDVILHGSVLIYPTAIERVLRRCPGVQEVVVVPVPDKLKHQNICACVIKARGESFSEEDLKRSMDNLLAFPRNVEIQTPQHVVFMDSFPLVQDAKINRKLLSQIAAEAVSQSE